MTQSISYTDKLQDRGFVDQWGFLIFCVFGFSGIIVAKHLKLDVVWVAAGACALMLLYALIVGRAGTGRLRADQAGDNCYYMGLIYTLASLSHAIFTFDPADTAGTIVQGFGVALATTILGLVLRVFFSQGRPDLENIEQQVRLELMEATSQLKSELNAVVQNMNDLSRQLQQSMQEIHTSARTTIELFAAQTATELQTATTAATDAIEGQSQDFVARSNLYSANIGTLVVHLERFSESLGAITDAHQALAKSAQETRTAAEATGSSAAILSKGLDATAQSTLSAANAASETTSQLAGNIERLEVGIKQILGEISQQLTAIKTGPADAITEAARAASKACQELSIQGESALAVTHDHNEALAKELARSRVMVSKVHSALVEMTENLANSVERSV